MAYVSQFETYLGLTKLTALYNAVKMKASPYDYVLSKRILFEDRDKCTNSYNLFNKGNNTEYDLADKLGLKDLEGNYLNLHADFVLPEVTVTKTKDLGTDNNLIIGSYNLGTFIDYNERIVNEEVFLEDLRNYYGTGIGILNKVLVNRTQSSGALSALLMLIEKLFDKKSIISNLMYLATVYRDMPFKDLEDITFAKATMSSKQAPVMESYANIRHNLDSEATIPNSILLATSWIPKCNDITSKGLPSADMPKKGKPLTGALNKLGTHLGFIYGCEIIYQYSLLPEDERFILSDILRFGYFGDSVCTKLYSYPSDYLKINPDLEACFNIDPVIRFDNFRNYYKTVRTDKLFTSPNVYENEGTYPLFLARIATSCHHFAYKTARIKHAMLLYQEAKSKGLINKEDFVREAGGTDLGSLFSGLGDADADDEDFNDELLNLDTDSYASDDSDIPDKDKSKVDKYTKEKSHVALTAMDAIKMDLDKSKYDFDIKYVKHDVIDKDAYESIAENVRMIAVNLVKQIKEIRTYNTGGKQNGLLTGKLDKKNLWKYKTDPHIFYNNNYKIKEMDLAFGCVLDESGSMCGTKVKNGKITMILLHEVLNSLGINHGIIGHTSHNTMNSVIYKYFQFREENHYQLSKPYGLVKAEGRSGNCDSGALYYMQSVMHQVRNKDKIVIIFSDGEPTECTGDQLRKQVRAMEREGIHVIGVGINFASIKNYYPDYANGKNLKEMIDIVVSILKRYVLEKKE